MAKLIVGPVIGLVTDNSARVLVETDADAAVTLTLSSAGGDAAQVTEQVPGRQPTGIPIGGLLPDTTYALQVTGVSEPRPGRIKTLPADPQALNIAVVSCNFTPMRGETRLWYRLWDQYVNPGQIDMVFHIGDQVYGDQVFAESMNDLGSRTAGSAAQTRRIIERYRTLYRHTWSYPPTQQVLAHTSNLMIWDDHEIRDDWGSREEDKDPASQSQFVGRLARQVYREYQRQLWDRTATDPPSDGLEFHIHSWGPVTAIFLDQRGGRSFEVDPSRPYLGSKQWAAVEQALKVESTKVLLVLTSVPLCYMGLGVTGAAVGAVDDLRDHWSYGTHQKEQIEMIRALRMWKQAQPGERELLVIGGDVHVGGHTDIEHDKVPIFKQLITSAITNKPPSFWAYLLMRGLLETNERLGNSYSFEHSRFTRDRNFGIVLVRQDGQRSPLVEGSLVEA